ncbi:MAG: hypothetical protein ACQCN6_14375 [Candidatus Bathyarchaeia archaeon]|jgi:hypothetical protein
MRLGWLKESYSETIRKYVEIDKARSKAYKIYNATPERDRHALVENFRALLPLNIAANMYMINAIDRFSPKIAASLKQQVNRYSKNQQKYLKKDFLNKVDQEYPLLSEEHKDDYVKSLINTAVDAGKIYEKEVQMAFVVAMDTLERVRGHVPLIAEERLLRALEESDSSLAKRYRGAYSTLETDNPERFRHCSVSMRELIDGTFGKTADERRRNMQLIVRSKQELEILDSLYNLIRSIDLAFNKGVHDEIQAETALLAVEATELMLNYKYQINSWKKQPDQ